MTKRKGRDEEGKIKKGKMRKRNIWKDKKDEKYENKSRKQ